MQVSFAHANPDSGNESFIIRFSESGYEHTPCILVDSGYGVDVDSQLGEDDYLLGILLTHGHSDHYYSLSDNIQDGASVYAAQDTADILELVLKEGSRHQNLGDTSKILDNLVALNGWEPLLDSIRVSPIPAGHCPGAAGFVIQFKEDSEWRTIVASGDFTDHRAGGYPGFPADMMLNVEAVFLTGATSTTDERSETIRTAIEQANAGARTLVTATGLSGVQLAYLMGHVIEQESTAVPIRVVGQTAKLYRELGYDVPNVEMVPEFDRTEPVLIDGGITIAGPQVPTEGASGRLFGALKSDPSGAVIQMTDGGSEPIESAQCTLYDFEYIGHPTEDVVDETVKTLDPTEVIITHQSGTQADRYKDKYTSYVWATDDTDWHSIFEGRWLSPPWMTSAGRQMVRNSGKAQRATLIGEAPLPSLERREDVDLEAEGIDISTIAEITNPGSVSTSAATEYSTTSGEGAKEASGRETGVESGSQEVVEVPADADLAGLPESAKVRVVDAGAGVKLLRIVDINDVARPLEHGEEFEIVLERNRD